MYGYALFSALLHPVGGVRPGSGQICPTTWYTCSISNTRERAYYLPPRRLFVLALSPSIDMYLLSAHFRPTTMQFPCVDFLIVQVLLGDHLADPIQSSLEVHPLKHLANAKRRGGMRGEVVKSALAAYLFNVAIVGDEGLSLMAAVPRRRALIFTAIPRPQ